MTDLSSWLAFYTCKFQQYWVDHLLQSRYVQSLDFFGIFALLLPHEPVILHSNAITVPICHVRK